MKNIYISLNSGSTVLACKTKSKPQGILLYIKTSFTIQIYNNTHQCTNKLIDMYDSIQQQSIKKNSKFKKERVNIENKNQLDSDQIIKSKVIRLGKRFLKKSQKLISLHNYFMYRQTKYLQNR